MLLGTTFLPWIHHGESGGTFNTLLLGPPNHVRPHSSTILWGVIPRSKRIENSMRTDLILNWVRGPIVKTGAPVPKARRQASSCKGTISSEQPRNEEIEKAADRGGLSMRASSRFSSFSQKTASPGRLCFPLYSLCSRQIICSRSDSPTGIIMDTWGM